MATSTGEADRLEAVRRRLRDDYVFFAERAVVIVDKRGQKVPLKLKRPQKRLLRAMMAQRDAGQPQRAIALKARQVGISTVCQSVLTGRATQNENHLALDLAQDRKTAGKLFKMGQVAHANLPADIKPPIARQADTEDRKYMVFGEPSQQMRRAGILGLNSSMEISTSKGLAGRGLTPRSLHVSEYAWWEDGEAILGVINGVPDDEDSWIVKESTAKGHNFFKDEWDLAVAGEGGYYPFFSPWFEEEDYRRPFANIHEQLEFEQSVGYHPRYGDDEPWLYELIKASYLEWHAEEPYPWLEAAERGEIGTLPFEETLHVRVLQHLNWRRWKISSSAQGRLERFKQEYPATPEEAFLATGIRVFDPQLVTKVLKRCERTDPAVPSAETAGPVPGLFRIAEKKEGRDRSKSKIEIPTSALWVPAPARAHDEIARWRLWQAPQKARDLPSGERAPDGQYIVFCDPASGATDEKGVTHAETAIEVIDHRTRRQVAEWAGQVDPDLVALELLLVAMYFNSAWIAVEVTGGYGLSHVRKLALDWKYPKVYTEQSRDKRLEKHVDRLGWHTDAVSKPLMEAELQELLRIEKDGIRSAALARQMLTFIRDDRGRTKPEAGKLSDKLMAYMGAQIVAKTRPIRPDRDAPSGAKKKPAKRRPKRSKTGY